MGEHHRPTTVQAERPRASKIETAPTQPKAPVKGPVRKVIETVKQAIRPALPARPATPESTPVTEKPVQETGAIKATKEISRDAIAEILTRRAAEEPQYPKGSDSAMRKRAKWIAEVTHEVATAVGAPSPGVEALTSNLNTRDLLLRDLRHRLKAVFGGGKPEASPKFLNM